MKDERTPPEGLEPERWQRVKAIFNAALDMTAPEREAFLNDACAGDTELRAEVQSLLEGDELAKSRFWQVMPSSDRTATAQAPDSESSLGHQIGSYRLLHKIGEGGMGEVWLAQQKEPIRRRVALKLIKPGMDSRQVLARFEAERQALALMDHPNVAKVLDAGADERGRPYFVMEFVKGVPITEHCDTQRLTTKQRLELFMQVCEGVQHAHQKAIIHRDIKPSNVLVAIQDGKPVPKIIDFGVAKATNHQLTEKTLFTEFGLLIGTPAYMSPEQAEMSSQDVDTRTDVYSLGVLLYELLVSALPFDAATIRLAGLDEMRRTIREEEPSKPSSRLSTLGDAATSTAYKRRTDSSTLTRQLRGDLDWITMRALEKSRTRRYPSASELAADLHRWACDEPVQAGPQSLSYRLQKLLKRHRGLVGATIAVILSLALGLGLSAVFLIRSETARRLATKREVEARQQGYVANIVAAEASLRVGETRGAKRRLALCEPSARGWEWDHLRLRSDASLARLHSARSGRARDASVEVIRFDPIAGSLLVGSGPATNRLEAGPGLVESWTITTNDWSRLLTAIDDDSTIPGDERVTTVLAISSDGTLAVSQSTSQRGIFDPTLKVWDLDSGTVVAKLQGHTERVISASFDAGGRHVMSGSADNTARLWDVTSGKQLAVLRGHSAQVDSVALSVANQLFVSASSWDGSVRFWDLETMRGDRLDLDNWSVVAISPNGQFLATGHRSGIGMVWDANTRQPVAPLIGHLSTILAIAFSRDGSRIATGSGDNSVRLWVTDTGLALATYHGHDGPVRRVAVNSDASLIASASWSDIRLWKDTDKSYRRIATPRADEEVDITAVALSSDGGVFASSLESHDGCPGGPTTTLQDADSGALIFEVASNTCGAFDVALSPDGRRITEATGIVRTWDVETNTLLYSIEDGGVSVDFSPDGQRVVTGGESGVQVLDSHSGALIARVHLPARGADGYRSRTDPGVAFGVEGRLLAVWYWDGLFHLIDWESSEIVASCDTPSGLAEVHFSPAGHRVVSATADGTLQLWEFDSCRVIATLRGHEGRVNSVRFHPSGDRLASGGADGTVRVWNAETGDLLLTLRDDPDEVSSLAFSSDGSRLLAGSYGGYLRRWDGGGPPIGEP